MPQGRHGLLHSQPKTIQKAQNQLRTLSGSLPFKTLLYRALPSTYFDCEDPQLRLDFPCALSLSVPLKSFQQYHLYNTHRNSPLLHSIFTFNPPSPFVFLLAPSVSQPSVHLPLFVIYRQTSVDFRLQRFCVVRGTTELRPRSLTTFRHLCSHFILWQE